MQLFRELPVRCKLPFFREALQGFCTIPLCIPPLHRSTPLRKAPFFCSVLLDIKLSRVSFRTPFVRKPLLFFGYSPLLGMVSLLREASLLNEALLFRKAHLRHTLIRDAFLLRKCRLLCETFLLFDKRGLPLMELSRNIFYLAYPA